MPKCISSLLFLSLVFCLSLAGPLQAQEVDSKDKVVATVNGDPITASEVEYAAEDLLAQLAAVPAKHRYKFLVNYLVERKLLAQAAERAKIAKTKEFERRAKFYRAKAMRDAYFKSKIEPRVTEKQAMAVYKKETAKIKPQDEVRARLITVQTEKEIKAILEVIEKGAAFEDLAKAKSIAANAPSGGDLGYFSKDRMVPALAEAAFSLKNGEVSKPIKSNQGWSIVKVEDRRKQQIQEFDKIKTRIRNVLLREQVTKIAEKLRSKAEIEYLDPDAKPEEPKE